MGRVAKWIDSLRDGERDAIIQHPDPTYHGRWWWDKETDCGCLVGCVIGAKRAGEWMLLANGPLFESPEFHVGVRFPELTRRFTPERMWRLVKTRAARGDWVEIPAVTEEAAAV